jgi:hypothetical protein
LIARSPARLEAEQVKHLLHRDLPAKLVEIDSRHVFLSMVAGQEGRSVPSLF